MKYIIYISSTVKLLSGAQLAKMLTETKKHNHALKITGMMIYVDGTFIHALEGPEEAVKKVYHKIEQAPYHKNIIKLAEDDLPSHNFSNWSMAFSSADQALTNGLDGYENPASKDFLNVDSNHAAVLLLKNFAHSNRIAYTQTV